METTQSPVARALGFWQRLNKRLRWALGIVAAALVVVIIVLAITSNTVQYEVLFSGLEPEAAAEVYSLLQDMEIEYQVSGTNRITISVPKGRRAETLLQLTNEGYPATAAELYTTIMSNASGFAATESDKERAQNTYLQELLAYSIRKMDKIEDVQVIITPQKESSFVISNGNRVAQASVVLEIKNNETLSQSEAEAVRQTVLNGVAGLQPENITIADTSLKIYSFSGETESIESMDDRLVFKQRAQDVIKEQVCALLYPVFGQEYVTVAADVELDWDKKSTQSVTYSPPGDAENMGIIVSLRQTASRIYDDLAAEGVVGFDSNGAAPFYPEDFSEEGSPYFNYTQELNAEINEVREQVEEATGKWKSVHVSVSIDDSYELTDELLESLRGHIANGVGIDPAYVSLMTYPFKSVDDLEKYLAEQGVVEEPVDNSLTVMFLAIAGGILLLAAIAIFLILNRAKKRRLAYEQELKRLEEERRLAEAQQKAEISEAGLRDRLLEEDELSNRLKDIQQLADESPEAVAQVLRNWLTDEFGR